MANTRFLTSDMNLNTLEARLQCQLCRSNELCNHVVDTSLAHGSRGAEDQRARRVCDPVVPDVERHSTRGYGLGEETPIASPSRQLATGMVPLNVSAPRSPRHAGDCAIMWQSCPRVARVHADHRRRADGPVSETATSLGPPRYLSSTMIFPDGAIISV